MEILWFFIIGAIAEFVDGTMGMAYGVINNSFLLSLGVVPALASACIHSAEVFTTFASGVSHLKLGNVDKKLFFNLVIPGCIFGGIGAALLSSFDFGRSIKPFVSVYLVIMGCVILIRSFKKNLVLRRVNAKALASVGGLFDA
ncbi:MAG: sulfite exporter TauE/SafE family protein, partial [Thermofilum sp.]